MFFSNMLHLNRERSLKDKYFGVPICNQKSRDQRVTSLIR